MAYASNRLYNVADETQPAVTHRRTRTDGLLETQASEWQAFLGDSPAGKKACESLLQDLKQANGTTLTTLAQSAREVVGALKLAAKSI